MTELNEDIIHKIEVTNTANVYSQEYFKVSLLHDAFKKWIYKLGNW